MSRICSPASNAVVYNLLLCVFCLGIVREVGAAGGDDISLQTILDAWKSQTAAIESARFTWSETRVDLKGSIFHPEFDKGFPIEMSGYVPPQDHTSSSTVTLLLHGELIRIDSDEEMYSSSEEEYVRRYTKASFDGSKAVVLSHGSDKVIDASVTDKPEVNFEILRYRPLLLALRPARENISKIPIEELKLAVEPTLVGNRLCRRVRAKRPNGYEQSFDVDPMLGYCIVRYISGTNGKPQTVVEIDYTSMGAAWIPTKWKIERHRLEDGSISLAYSAAIKQHSVNQGVAKNDFALEVPAGAAVTDMRTVKESSLEKQITSRRGLFVVINLSIVVLLVLVVAARKLKVFRRA